MAMIPTERHGTRLAGWVGIFAATAVAGPAASRPADVRVSWSDVAVVVAGALLLFFRAVPLVLLEGSGGS